MYQKFEFQDILYAAFDIDFNIELIKDLDNLYLLYGSDFWWLRLNAIITNVIYI